MGRHSQRKYGNSLAVNNSRIIRSHTHKAHIHGNGDLPYGVGHTRQYRFQNQGLGLNSRRGVAPIGLLGLAGAGLIGYALLKKNKTFGWNSFGTSGIATGRVSSWKKFLPFKSALTLPIGTTTAAAAPTGILNNGIIGNVAKAPIVHNRKVPIKERVLSKVTGRPVVTNYH